MPVWRSGFDRFMLNANHRIQLISDKNFKRANWRHGDRTKSERRELTRMPDTEHGSQWILTGSFAVRFPFSSAEILLSALARWQSATERSLEHLRAGSNKSDEIPVICARGPKTHHRSQWNIVRVSNGERRATDGKNEKRATDSKTVFRTRSRQLRFT